MKRLFGIFQLSENEQRVVLIIVFILMTIAFVAYERRTHEHPLHQTSAIQPQASPSPVKTEDDPGRTD